MRKQIKKYGDAFIISFSAEERKIFDIKEDDIFDIELVKIKQMKGGKNGK